MELGHRQHLLRRRHLGNHSRAVVPDAGGCPIDARLPPAQSGVSGKSDERSNCSKSDTGDGRCESMPLFPDEFPFNKPVTPPAPAAPQPAPVTIAPTPASPTPIVPAPVAPAPIAPPPV